MGFDLQRQTCKACKMPSLIKFISFGKMPIANAFVKPEDLEKPEYFYNMEVGFCENCKMVQLVEMPPYDKYIVPDSEGKTQYAFFSSTSSFMEKHFAELAREVESRFLTPDSKVLEIGSNDGIMLKAFQNHRVLGIEPSQNVAEIAQKQGIETLTDFFTKPLAERISRERGKFKTILSTNVFLNIIGINECLEGINILLDDNGVFITEDPYILDILEKTSYDQIYDEHVWYFSLTSLTNILKEHKLEIFDAERQWVHGGSMRIYMAKLGTHQKTPRLLGLLEEEKLKGLDTLEPYLKFAKNVEQSKQDLSALLTKLKLQDKKIVGYAAASKGTIVQNYCNITKDTLEYISDSTPFKQGLYSPGKHIPVVSPDTFHADKEVDYALLSAWNHAEEIMKKESAFLSRGGRFIVHYPSPRILEPTQQELTHKPQMESSLASNPTSLNLTSLSPTPLISNSVNKPQALGEIQFKKIQIFQNDQGYLFETIRADDKIFDGKFGQVVVSALYPGVIKGLHKHSKQTDYTTCIKGNIKYVVAKENSNGTADIKTYTIGEKNPVIIKVPPGYWHGYSPLANEQATVLHLMDELFDSNDDDTERKDAYAFGDPWTVKPS
jgi:dTDP-4-dehydrorhamnose 3,5-epimerase-like enzyme